MRRALRRASVRGVAKALQGVRLLRWVRGVRLTDLRRTPQARLGACLRRVLRRKCEITWPKWIFTAQIETQSERFNTQYPIFNPKLNKIRKQDSRTVGTARLHCLCATSLPHALIARLPLPATSTHRRPPPTGDLHPPATSTHHWPATTALLLLQVDC